MAAGGATQPEVERASVNLLTRTAAVWFLAPEAEAQAQAGGEAEAVQARMVRLVTERGFPASLRPTGAAELAKAAAATNAKHAQEVCASSSSSLADSHTAGERRRTRRGAARAQVRREPTPAPPR